MEKVCEPFTHFPQHAPWLVFFSHGKRRKAQSFFTLVEGRSYVKNIPQLSGKACLFSSHGWLLMAGPEATDCSLFHPKTMKTVHLPPLPLENQFPYDSFRCFLSSVPTDPNCVLLFAACLKPEIMICHLSQNMWEKEEYKLDEYGGLFDLVTCNGKLYGMTFEDNLVIVDFDPNLNVVMIPGISQPKMHLLKSRWERNLLESSGEIFVVYKELTYTGTVVTFNVYKVDLLEQKWVEVQSIGDKAFFLCKTGSVSCSAIDSGIRGDSIYFVHPGDPSVYRFDMADRGICLDLAWPSLTTPWNEPYWVFLDELCHSCTLPPSQESLQELASSDTDGLTNYFSLNKVVAKNELETVDNPSEVGPWSDPVPFVLEHIDGLTNYFSLNKVVVKNELETVDNASEVGPWSDPVPFVLEHIAGRLTLASRLSMSRVCKAWPSIIRSIPAYNGLSYGYPCQASIDRDGKTCTLVDPNCNELHIKCENLPPLCIILYSLGGWLLVVHPLDCKKRVMHSIFFFNPLTKAKIDLPNINFSFTIRSFAFSTPPTSPDCIVIAFRPNGCNISICRREDREWIDLGNLDEHGSLGMSHVSPVFCNESFYCLADDGRLGVFDPRTKVWSIIPNDTSTHHLLSKVKELYVVESDGELIMVFADKFGDMVGIQKLDPSENKWKDIDNIGGRSLFVGRRSSICSKADILIGDGVYFPRIKDGAFMFYSMGEHKFRQGGNFYRSEVFQLSFWIDPVFDSSYEEQLKWNE